MAENRHIENQCRGTTKLGKRCGAAATQGGLCFFHANPKKAVELGRIGGRKNGRLEVDSDPLPDLDNVTAVRDAVKRMIADVYSGKLHPRTAAGLASLLQLQMRVIEKTDIEQRIAKVETQLVRLGADLEESERKKGQSSGTAGAYQTRLPEAVKP